MKTAPEKIITAADKLKCIERELKRRYEVYPHLVDSKKRTQTWADREIALMEEIASGLREAAEKERLL